jgi:hypothetical protein
MDLFTRIFKKLIIPNNDNEIISYTNIADVELDTVKSTTEFTLYGHKFYHSRRIFLEFGLWLLSSLPFSDSNVRKDYLTLINNFKEDYKEILRHEDVLLHQTNFNLLHEFDTDPHSDLNMQIILKQGPASLLIQQVDDNLYKVDLNEMSKFAVRSGFVPYGGCIYFDAKFNLKSIDYLEKTYKPEDTHWINAKYIFRSSLIVYNTIKTHAGYFHLFYGSHVPHALKKLSHDHYLYKLMLPFTYKNLETAELARIILYGRKKYFHRVFAFTEDGLNDFNKYIFDNFYHNNLIEHEMILESELVKNSPYFEDGENLWVIIESFVTNYFKKYYDKNDVQLHKLINNLMKNSNNKFDIENTLESVVIFFSQYIFMSTCMHEMTGNNILKYIFDPRFMSAKLRWDNDINNMYPDDQTYQQSVLIAVATSLMKLPKITDDFSYIFDDKEDKELVVNFQEDLKKLAKTIDERNMTRQKPFYGAHPSYLEISMSV